MNISDRKLTDVNMKDRLGFHWFRSVSQHAHTPVPAPVHVLTFSQSRPVAPQTFGLTRAHPNSLNTHRRDTGAAWTWGCALGLLLHLLPTPVAQAATHRFRLPDPAFKVANVLVTDPAGHPHAATVDVREGMLIIELPLPLRIAVHLLCAADPAGTLMVTADNRGLGYEPGTEPYELSQELLYSATGRRSPSQPWPDTIAALGKALISQEEKILTAARAAINARKATTRRVQLSQREAVPQSTRVSIEQRTTEPLLGFGQAFYDKVAWRVHTEALFDYVVLPFYLKSLSPVRDQYKWERIEATARWCGRNGLETKGHPLVWFFDQTTPDWMKKLSYAELRQFVEEHVTRNVEHFEGLIRRWDVINEAHGWANCLKLTNDQLLDITDVAVRAARKADPTCQLVVNCCLPWGDDIQLMRDPTRMSPIEYYQRLIRMGCPFDVIGVQLYDSYAATFPHRNLAAMSEILDRFGRLGKEIHVTEFAVPSAGKAFGVWRGEEWTPDLQAGFSRGFYEVACSKPFVKSINWWFPVDVPNTDWAHLGLVSAANTPKPVLTGLIELKRSWLTRTSAVTDSEGWVQFQGLPGQYVFNWTNPTGELRTVTINVRDDVSTPQSSPARN